MRPRFLDNAARRGLARAAVNEAIASGRLTKADVDQLLNLYHAVMTGERMASRGPDISDADLLAALRMRDSGATYPEIVRALGRSCNVWQRRLSAIYAEMDDA